MAKRIDKKLQALSDLRMGKTITQVCKKYAVHRNTVSEWKKNADLTRGDMLPLVQSAIEKKTIDELAELGMPKREALKILIDGMLNPMVTQFEGEGDQMIATPSKDYKIIHKYLQEYLKLVDAYPAEKHNVNIKMVVVNVTEKLIACMAKYVPESKRPEMAIEVEQIFKEVEDGK